MSYGQKSNPDQSRRKSLQDLGLIGLNAIGAISTVNSLSVHAQTFPNKPIRALVGAAPGSPQEFLARVFADNAGPVLGQPIIVETKPGASGTIAADAMFKAASDGHTLLFSGPAAVTVQPHLNSKLAYDPLKDFQPVVMMAAGPMALVAHPSVQVSSVSELVALLKKGPALSYGSGGNGSASHLCAELFAKQAGVKLLHVPYKGEGQALVDLVSGQIKLMFSAPNVTRAQVINRQLNLLAVTSKERSPSFPNTPSVHESAGAVTSLKNFEYLGWNAAFAQASVSTANIQALVNAWEKVRLTPAVKSKMDELSMSAPDRLISGPALNDFIQNEYRRFGGLIKELGIKQE